MPTLYPPNNEATNDGQPDRRPSRAPGDPAANLQTTIPLGKAGFGRKPNRPRLRLARLDLELLHRLATLGYMTTYQILDARQQIAEAMGLPVAQIAADRVVQRRLRQLVEAGILRRIAQPVFPTDHTGSKPYVFALDRVGAHVVSHHSGLDLHEIDWQPKEAERKASFLFLDHTLAIVDFYLALTRACTAHDVTLAQWTGERVLRRHPAKVPVWLDNGRQETVPLVPDAFYQLMLPSEDAAWLFLEMDLGTMTIEPTHWQLRAWRRKFLAYRFLPDDGLLQAHYGANAMLVTVVTTSPTRAANLVEACERAGGDTRFWFATAED